MDGKQIEIYRGAEGEIVFDVDAELETLWATQAQIAQAFGVDRTVVGRHIRNILQTGELEEKRVCAKNAHTAADGKTYQVQFYNLDMIISVGYRVNSKKATDFRIWATRVLKQYLTTGVAVNQRRLRELDSARLREVEGMMGLVRRLTTRSELDAAEANGVLEVISKYAGSFEALEQFDDGEIKLKGSAGDEFEADSSKVGSEGDFEASSEGYVDLRGMNGPKRQKKLTVEMCDEVIGELKQSVGGSELFGKRRNGSFDGDVTAIYQEFEGKELYPSVPEKAANLLYFIIKDHPFYDGNKRIGALLFIMFLTINDFHLTAQGETKISDRALTAIALLIAESEPSEKDLIVSLVRKLLED